MSVYARRGTTVRVIYVAVALLWWLLTGGGRWGGPRVVTLCYHGVTRRQRKRFRRQMERIAGRAVPSAAAGAVPASGSGGRRGSLPGVCVTFDDAFANLLENALSVTRALRIPVTLFAVAEGLGSRPGWEMDRGHPDRDEPMMSADQLAEAAAAGCTIGSHSATHRRLDELSPAEARQELSRSKALLEGLLGRPVEEFAFPHGAFDRQLVEDAFAAGYKRLFTLDPSSSATADRGRVVGRMPMSPDVWPIEHMLTTTGAYAWLPAVRRFVHRLRQARRRPGGAAARRTRVLAVASGGGHWVQLLRLGPALAGERVTYVTVSRAHRADVGPAPFHVVNDATGWERWGLVRLAIRMAWLVGRLRPDVVVTTGAAPGYFALLFGKLLGARTIWIDSMANVDRLSLSGRKARRWADLRLTQWPALARTEGPHYEGAVL